MSEPTQLDETQPMPEIDVDEVAVAQVNSPLPLSGGKQRIHEDGSVYAYDESDDLEEVRDCTGFAAVPQGDG